MSNKLARTYDTLSPGTHQNMIVSTKTFWNERGGHCLTDAQAREAVNNVSALVSILDRWSKEALQETKLNMIEGD